jgi:hypothetical protein
MSKTEKDMGFETKEGLKFFLQKLLEKILVILFEFLSLPFIFGA